MSVLDVPNYRERTRMEQITRDIPRDDARWLAQRLCELTDGPDARRLPRGRVRRTRIVETLTRAMQRRIAALGAFVKLIIEPADGVAPMLAAINAREDERGDCDLPVRSQGRRVGAHRGRRQGRPGDRPHRVCQPRRRDAACGNSNCGSSPPASSSRARHDDLIRYHGKYILIDRRMLYVLSFNFTQARHRSQPRLRPDDQPGGRACSRPQRCSRRTARGSGTRRRPRRSS